MREGAYSRAIYCPEPYVRDSYILDESIFTHPSFIKHILICQEPEENKT